MRRGLIVLALALTIEAFAPSGGIQSMRKDSFPREICPFAPRNYLITSRTLATVDLEAIGRRRLAHVSATTGAQSMS